MSRQTTEDGVEEADAVDLLKEISGMRGQAEILTSMAARLADEINHHTEALSEIEKQLTRIAKD